MENPQTYAQIGEEIEETPRAGLGRSARHFSNRYRTAQVFYRELPEEHFLQGIERQQAHGPGALRSFHHRIQRAETNLAQHLGRPFTAFDARTKITAPRFTLSASSKCQRHINTLPVTLNLENSCRAGQNLDRV